MDAPTVDQVVELALEFFSDRAIGVSLTDEGLATEDGRIFGLEPLRRRLACSDPAEWTEMVRGHFEVLLTADHEMPPTFAAAAPNLRSAVVAEVDLGLFDGAIMERPLVDGLGERLMLRRGILGLTVTEETVQRWDGDLDEVWATARRNSLWDEPVHRESMRIGAAGYTAIRGGRWTSTRILDLSCYLDPRIDYGALVAVPARDEVLVHQIRDESFTDAALAMLSHAVDAYIEAPLPVGCDLYWWSGWDLARICAPAEDRYRYIRVPEFSAMLWRLEEETAERCARPRQRRG
ncbi:MAG: hypothetical protein ACRDVD_08465 [Acidimicrobiia bacterium]